MMQNQDQNDTPVNTDIEPTSLAPNTSVAAGAVGEGNALPALKLAREAKRLSVGDVAYALKVSPRVIEALESGDWKALPGRTFTLGMLRAYGRMLDTSVDALVASVPGAGSIVRKTVDQEKAPRNRPKASDRRDGEAKRQTNKMSKLGIFMVLVAVALAYAVPADYWHALVEEGQAFYERLGSKQPGAIAPESNSVTLPANAQSASATSAQSEQQMQTGTGTLELRFAAPAWVEVRDYTGRIIYSQLNAAGATQFITGAAPLDVLIGNAKQVQARWRDEPLKLDKLSSDDVARQILR